MHKAVEQVLILRGVRCGPVTSTFNYNAKTNCDVTVERFCLLNIGYEDKCQRRTEILHKGDSTYHHYSYIKLTEKVTV